MDAKTNCSLCGYLFKNNKSLSSHVRQVHNISVKQYYDYLEDMEKKMNIDKH